MPLSKEKLVFVVDDEEAVRTFVAKVLQREGYKVRIAADGQEAVDLFRDQPQGIGLLLTDLAMPRKNGIDLVREVRAITPSLPVIVMSGNMNDWEKSLDGFARLAKPFAIATLLKAVGDQIATNNATRGER